MKPDLFRTPEATLIENLVYEETSEQVQVTLAMWVLNGEAHAAWNHEGTEYAATIEGLNSSAKLAQAVANEIVRRIRGKR